MKKNTSVFSPLFTLPQIVVHGRAK